MLTSLMRTMKRFRAFPDAISRILRRTPGTVSQSLRFQYVSSFLRIFFADKCFWSKNGNFGYESEGAPLSFCLSLAAERNIINSISATGRSRLLQLAFCTEYRLFAPSVGQ